MLNPLVLPHTLFRRHSRRYPHSVPSASERHIVHRRVALEDSSFIAILARPSKSEAKATGPICGGGRYCHGALFGDATRQRDGRRGSIGDSTGPSPDHRGASHAAVLRAEQHVR